MATMSREIVLGSGKIYCLPYVDGEAIGSLRAYCKEENRLGLVKGGASITYEVTPYEVFDDLHEIYKRFVIGEKASLKTGLITFDLETMERILGNSNYFIDENTGVKTLKLGGHTREQEQFIVVFEHERRDGSRLIVGLAATNDAGLNLNLLPDKETQLDAEFNAVSNDSNGCLLIIEEVPVTGEAMHVDHDAIDLGVGHYAQDIRIINNIGDVTCVVKDSSEATATKVHSVVSTDSEKVFFYADADATTGTYTATLTDSKEGTAQTCTVTITVA